MVYYLVYMRAQHLQTEILTPSSAVNMYFIDMCFLIVESHVTNSEQGQFQTTCSSRDILVQFFSSPLLDVLFADTRTPEHMVVLVTLQDRPLHATEYTPLSPTSPSMHCTETFRLLFL